jgi:hypothetical protein
MILDWFQRLMNGKSKEDRQFQFLDERLIDVQGKLRNLKAEVIAQANSNQGKFTQLIELQQQILKAINDLQLPAPPVKPLEVRFMFIVKDDNPAVNFSLVLGDVTDAEGNKVPDAQLDVAVESSNPDAVTVSFDSASKSGSVSFGNPGVASVTATASNNGKILGSGAADFTVTVGDPAAITSVALNFDGLTEV